MGRRFDPRCFFEDYELPKGCYHSNRGVSRNGRVSILSVDYLEELGLINTLTLLRTVVDGLKPNHSVECPECKRTISYYGLPDFVWRLFYHVARHH